MIASGDPIRPDELDRLFAPAVAHGERVAIAVSGGSDSTVLMVLFADWLRCRAADPSLHTVLTVDHRLRPESAAEAEAVGHHAAALGFRHAILTWDDPKPATGLQAAAREARYRLCADYALRHGIVTLMTAHTADDQAETLLMRLARGSGVDGLAAMAPRTGIVAGADSARLTLVRPLLDVPKARLRATLEARGISWSEDPSNRSPAFERPRLRAAAAELGALGLTTERLALSARRLRRAREALQRWTDDFCHPEAGNFQVDPCGFLRVDTPSLRGLPLEIAVRVLARAVVLAGGSAEPVPLAGLEAIAEAVCAASGPTAGAWTLARAKIAATPASIVVEREPGREALPTLTLAPGAQAWWDGRFLLRAGPQLPSDVEIRPLGIDGLREVRGAVPVAANIPVGALRTLPALWRDASLLAAPNLHFWARDGLRDQLQATFAAPGAYNPAPADDAPEAP